MKVFALFAAVVALSAPSFADLPILLEIDLFYNQSVIDANVAFKQLFDTTASFIAPIAADLRAAYTSYQLNLANFPLTRLNATTKAAFQSLIKDLDFYLERGVASAEVDALNFLWYSDPNGVRGSPTPADYSMTQLRMPLDLVKNYLTYADPICVEPVIPTIIPSFQVFTDIIVNAALNVVPNVPSFFTSSLDWTAKSVASTKSFIATINACASKRTTNSCIGNFVSSLNPILIASN